MVSLTLGLVPLLEIAGLPGENTVGLKLFLDFYSNRIMLFELFSVLPPNPDYQDRSRELFQVLISFFHSVTCATNISRVFTKFQALPTF